MNELEHHIRTMGDRVYMNETPQEVMMLEDAIRRRIYPIRMLEEAINKELKEAGLPEVNAVTTEIYYDEDMVPYDSTIIPISFGHLKNLPHYLLLYRDNDQSELEVRSRLVIDIFRVSNGFVSMVDNDPPEEMTQIGAFVWDDMRLTTQMKKIAKQIREDYFYKVFPKLDYKNRYSNHADTLIALADLLEKSYEMHMDDWVIWDEDRVVRKKHRDPENDRAKIVANLVALGDYSWNYDPYWIARRDGLENNGEQKRAKNEAADKFADILVKIYEHITGYDLHQEVAHKVIDKIAANPEPKQEEL